MGVTRVYLGFCMYRGRRDAHFLFGMARIWWSGLWAVSSGARRDYERISPLHSGVPWRGVGPSAYLGFFLAFSRLPALVNVLTNFLGSLQAALALRSLCDANRRALASGIDAFAEMYAGLGGVPVGISTMTHTLLDAD